jgi:hypothetical protein
MAHNLTFDMTDVRIRRMLYRYHNRAHDGEIWLAFRTPTGILLMEQNGQWPESEGSKLLGEVRTRLIGGEFVDDIIPLQHRNAADLAGLHEQAKTHRRYRAELYKRYPLLERLEDLNRKNLVKAKQERPN